MKKLNMVSKVIFAESDDAAWIQKLSDEYDRINQQYRLNLSRPTFAIDRKHPDIWGYWQADERTLSIAADCLRQPWEVVTSILKHEMCHQLSSELIELEPHDTRIGIFKLACFYLDIPEESNKHYFTEPEQTLASSKMKISTKERYTLSDKSGNSAEVVILGTHDGEAVIAEGSYKSKSKIMAAVTRYHLIEKALIAAGLMKWIGKLA